MAKLKTIGEINLRSNHQVFVIPKDSFINVSEGMAVFLCNEDIEALSLEEQKRNSRVKKAVRSNDLSATYVTYDF